MILCKKCLTYQFARVLCLVRAEQLWVDCVQVPLEVPGEQVIGGLWVFSWVLLVCWSSAVWIRGEQ